MKPANKGHRIERAIRCAVLAAAAAVCTAALVGAAGFSASDPCPVVSYTVALKDPHLSVLTVTIDVRGELGSRAEWYAPSREGCAVLDPIGLAATDCSGGPLAVEHERERWIVRNGGVDYVLSYDVVLTIVDRYSPRIRGMLTYVGADRCRLLGGDILLLPASRATDGVLVDFDLDPGWKLRSGYPSVGNRVIIPSIDELPTTMAVSGAYRYLEGACGSSEIVLAISGDWSFPDEEIFDCIERIVRGETGMFGSSPFGRSLFVCDPNPVRGGNRFDLYGVHIGRNMVLLLDTRLDRSLLYDTPMSIIAHEFFHNWNGEVLKPAGTDLLWFTEGATVYFSFQVLLDQRIISITQYERNRDQVLERYLGNPLVDSVPLSAAANGDLGDKNMVNLLYDGGYLAAEALDRRIGEETGGRVGLIDVLVSLYRGCDGACTIDETDLVGEIRRLGAGDLSTFLRELAGEPAPHTLSGFAQSS